MPKKKNRYENGTEHDKKASLKSCCMVQLVGHRMETCYFIVP